MVAQAWSVVNVVEGWPLSMGNVQPGRHIATWLLSAASSLRLVEKNGRGCAIATQRCSTRDAALPKVRTISKCYSGNKILGQAFEAVWRSGSVVRSTQRRTLRRLSSRAGLQRQHRPRISYQLPGTASSYAGGPQGQSSQVWRSMPESMIKPTQVSV